LVEQRLTGPALEKHHSGGIVHALEQLVLLAALFLQRADLQGTEDGSELGSLAGRDLDRDNVPDGHRSPLLQVFSDTAILTGIRGPDVASDSPGYAAVMCGGTPRRISGTGTPLPTRGDEAFRDLGRLPP
jgi:hypothetical protein